ncbi:MAG: hypothetical protein HFJ12_05200 [Bacilli bacterium]|nr:hypothetical protein [Bacilli bacterium]
MNIKTQIIVKSNPNIYRYLRENSYWYKSLNRNPESIKQLELEMRNRYKLTAEGRLEKLNNSMSLIRSFMDVLK